MTERINTGYAALQDSTGDEHTVHGVAIGVDDETKGASRKPTTWPADALKGAAAKFEGVPIVKDHPNIEKTNEGLKITGQAPIDSKVGEITRAKYKDGVGILWEGEITDDEMLQKVEDGIAEVSPVVQRELEQVDDDTYEATEIKAVRDLGLVSKGASPSNSIDTGAAAMSAEALAQAFEALESDLTPPEDVQEHAQEVLDWREEYDVDAMTDTGWNRAEQLASGEELSVDDVQEISAWFARHGSEEYELNEDGMDPWEDNGRVAIKGWGGPPMRSWVMDKREQLVEDGELEAMSAEALADWSTVAGVRFRGTRDGSLDESEIPNDDFEDHYLYPSDTKTESSYPVVDGDGYLRRGNVDSAWQLGARGRVSESEHDNKLKRLNRQFDNPPIDTDAESMGTGVTDPSNWEACSVDLPDSISQSDDGTQGGSSQSSVASDSDKTMTDELTDNEKAILEAAEDVEDSVEALNEIAATEQATVVAQDDYESLKENVEEVRGVLSEALSEKTELKDSTIEALEFDALCDEFRDDEGELQVEALRQQPETGEPESEDESGAEALSEDADVERAEALYEDMDKFGVDHEDKIVEALGVEDFDTATEVLN